MQEEQKQPIPQQSQQQDPQPVMPAEDNSEFKENIEKVYDIEGLLAGGAAGLVVGIIISFDIIFAAQIGMFLGLIIGTRFKKNKDTDTENKTNIKENHDN